MRKMLVLWGGHASGKTTFILDFLERHRMPNGVLAFSDSFNRKLLNTTRDKKVERIAYLLENRSEDIILEGMRLPGGLISHIVGLSLEYDFQLLLVVMLMSRDRMYYNLKKRKHDLGKGWTKKDQTYWTPSKIAYEASTRFINSINKTLNEGLDLRNTDLKMYRLSDSYHDFSVYLEVEMALRGFFLAYP